MYSVAVVLCYISHQKFPLFLKLSKWSMPISLSMRWIKSSMLAEGFLRFCFISRRIVTPFYLPPQSYWMEWWYMSYHGNLLVSLKNNYFPIARSELNWWIFHPSYGAASKKLPDLWLKSFFPHLQPLLHLSRYLLLLCYCKISHVYFTYLTSSSFSALW